MSSPSLLILGGSGFVGPAVIDAALAAGWRVTTFNRGRAATAPAPGIEALHGDRTDRGTLAVLAGRDFDLVLDTWSGAPTAVRDSAQRLREHAGRYVYVSSCSVYAPPPPIGLDEDSPTVAGSPDADDGEYPALKRGAELAVLEAFAQRALVLRPGLILGPGEDVGRLPWWLARMARGGEVLCPGPRELALQYIDARDLAAFALHAASTGVRGPLNTVSPRGHTTMGELLDLCRDVAGAPGTKLRWHAPEAILDAGIEPWSELPIWIPPGHDYDGMHGADVRRAHAAGLSCRPVIDTVRDTWAWMRAAGPGGPALRADLPAPGLSAHREHAVLSALN